MSATPPSRASRLPSELGSSKATSRASLSRTDSIANLSSFGAASANGRMSEEDGERSTIDGYAPSVAEWVGKSMNPAGRFDLGNLNLVSWKDDVVPRGAEIDSAEPGGSAQPLQNNSFNAISDLLYHPTKPPAPLRGSRKPLPPPPANYLPNPQSIPKPPPAGFYQPFLDALTKTGESSQGGISLWEAYQAASTPEVADTAETETKPPPSDKALGKRKATPEALRDESDLPDLGVVPSLFFDPKYNLSEEEMWERVRLQNEHLSHYLDVVESHLVHEIGLRAPSFFSALSNLEQLSSESADCLDQIRSLTRELNGLDETTALKGLSVIHGQDRLRRKRELKRAIEDVQAVLRVIKLCVELTEMGDWSGALEGLGEVSKWWRTHQSKNPSKTPEPGRTIPESLPTLKEEAKDESDKQPSGSSRHGEEDSNNLPLAEIPALNVIPEELASLCGRISTQLSTLLQTTFTTHLTAKGEPNRSAFATDTESLLIALQRCGAIDGVRETWKSAVLKVVRESMRQHLAMEEEGEAKSGLADALRSMSHRKFMDLSNKVYSSMVDALSRVKPLSAQLEDLLLVASKHESLTTHTRQEGAKNELSFSDLFTEACELAVARAAKVLVARTPQHADLPLEQFVAIFRQTLDFVSACEALADATMVSLRGVLTSQARAFVVKYHQARLQSSAKFVEEEQWSQVEVPSSTQHCVDLLCDAAVKDPAEMKLPSSNKLAESKITSSKSITVEGQAFYLVSATVKSLDMLADYAKLVVNLDMVATDIMSRIIEFLKVVLGAGAMRSAGLKNITAKHLALASQSLSVVVSIIPYIREFVRRHLQPKQAVMLVEFDKLRRDYQEHQYEIHAKLIAIMADRLAVHCTTMRAIDWEAKPTNAKVNSYAEQLVKETTTLYKVLSKYLADSTVRQIMSSVVDSIGGKMGDEVKVVELQSEAGKKRLLNDVTYLKDGMTPLLGDDLATPVVDLLNAVKAKTVPKKQSDIGQTLNGLLRRGGQNAQAPETGTGSEVAGAIAAADASESTPSNAPTTPGANPASTVADEAAAVSKPDEDTQSGSAAVELSAVEETKQDPTILAEQPVSDGTQPTSSTETQVEPSAELPAETGPSNGTVSNDTEPDIAGGKAGENAGEIPESDEVANADARVADESVPPEVPPKESDAA